MELYPHPLKISSAVTHVMGTQVFHEEMGSGSPLVLLHGLSDSHRAWRRVLPLLAQNHRVLALDLPGCGLSGRPDESYSLDWQAKVVNGWLAALGLDQVDIVGHSYGGGVAQYMLLLPRPRIRRLALVAAGGLGREVALKLRLCSVLGITEKFGQPFMAPLAVRALRAAGGEVDVDSEEWSRETSARPGTARAFSRMVRDVIDWRGQTRHFLHRAHEIREFPPTALFWGSDDAIIPQSHALRTSRILRGAELTIFRRSGHFPHQDHPEDFVRGLLSFVETENPQRVLCVPGNAAPATHLFSRLAQRVRSPHVHLRSWLRDMGRSSAKPTRV